MYVHCKKYNVMQLIRQKRHPSCSILHYLTGLWRLGVEEAISPLEADATPFRRLVSPPVVALICMYVCTEYGVGMQIP